MRKYKVSITIDGDPGVCDVKEGTINQIGEEIANGRVIDSICHMDFVNHRDIQSMTLKFGSFTYTIDRL